ncbi:hypothetical protein KKB55_13910, partial [Myxococcota bacterium]|nr:hypothetical protein [Myxococcota bacterium]MBU1898830.1 hypothetical protein [Myxococcota bacterium]
SSAQGGQAGVRKQSAERIFSQRSACPRRARFIARGGGDGRENVTTKVKHKPHLILKTHIRYIYINFFIDFSRPSSDIKISRIYSIWND